MMDFIVYSSTQNVTDITASHDSCYFLNKLLLSVGVFISVRTVSRTAYRRACTQLSVARDQGSV